MSIRASSIRPLASLPLRPCVFTRSLPADSYTDSFTESDPPENLLRVSRPVYQAAFAYISPEKAPDPKLVAVSHSALQEIELDRDTIKDNEDEFVQVFSGNTVLNGTRPWALCYGGHQFGTYADQLGDGRAISLFETQNSRDNRWEIQLKGAGRTPFSRFGDGYAVLRSSIREFLVSEHMHVLGVPTTRALSLIKTSREVFRDDAPPGVNQPEKGAVVARMASSWLRFGSFEIFHFRHDKENVRKLADYAIKEVVKDEGDPKKGNQYARFFLNVAKRTARMVAEWQALGAGDKVDTLVFSAKDDDVAADKAKHEMYRTMGKAFVTEVLSESFSDCFMEHLAAKMRSKLGLVKDKQDEDMQGLVIPLLDWMTEYRVDYHKFFRSLGDYYISDAGEDGDGQQALGGLLDIVPRDETVVDECKQALKPWLAMYRHRLVEDGPINNTERKKRMNSVNPRFVLRNWIVQDVINAFDNMTEEEATDMLNICLGACVDPYKDKYDDEQVETWIKSRVPEWAMDLKCSCSS
ncbi:hypothetical protein DFQ28_006030 [Apophysomyces sp. BC1034]|nr:hypothetical protein DFQ29_004949 [Apophysomyces sp. BC1021]KAG0187649.1 hypothetical protein DFQ28_006030 [Apophysomyces sp. BC1034]